MLPARLRILAFACLGVALCSLFAGCQYAYPFDVSGVVRDAATGKPLAGVQVFSTYKPSDAPLYDRLPPGEDTPVAVTGDDGTFSFSRRVPDHLFREGETWWALVFAKEGVGRELVDLRRVKRPSSPKTTSTVFVVLDFKGQGAQR